ncbi:SRPBCC family protein [Gimesia sp.]|uniref:SRPBCC family protein n=1 Tax=Gimesia sp. TaxID=2024833 RepID=UPI003A8DAC0A
MSTTPLPAEADRITRTPDGIYRLHTETVIPYALDEVFAFFAEPQNLEALTPPWLNFEITTPAPIEMRQGTLIDYRLKLHGIPVKWRTEISEWEPPFRFVDRQLKGPYRLWHHEHTFTECDAGTRVTDDVRYAVLGGALVNRLFVQKDIARIFHYRREQLRKFKPARSNITAR